MSHPTGDHEAAAKLAAGYVEVGVKYADGMEKIHKDFDAVEAHGKTVGENTGRNIVEAVTAAGAPAAQGFADKLRDTAVPATREATEGVGAAFKEGVVQALGEAGLHAGDASKGVVASFVDGMRQGFLESRLGDNADFLFNGFKERSSLEGQDAASSFMGRFIQIFKAHGSDAMAAGTAQGEAIKSGIAKSLEGLDAAGIAKYTDQLRQGQLDAKRNVIELANSYTQLKNTAGADVDELTAKHNELVAAQNAVRDGQLNITEATIAGRAARREAGGEGDEGLNLGEKTRTATESASKLTEGAASAAEGGLGAEGILGMGAAIGALADPVVLATGAVSGLVLGTGVLVDKVYELGEKWEDTFHNVQITTGATGEKLAGLEENVKGVYAQVPLSMQQVGSIVATVATSFKDTGDGVTQVATEVGKLQSMVGQIDLTALGKGFRGFGIGDNPQAQIDVLNQLFKATQATQIPINSLVDAMSRAAPIAQQFHLSIGATTAIMSQFDAAGIDPSRTMFTLAKAAQEATKQHKDFATVLSDEIEQVRNAATEQEKLDLAGQFFGKTSGRGGAAQIVQAINQGLTLDPAVLAQIENAAGLIDKTRQQTMTWGDTWTLVKHRISDALEPVSQQLREHVQAGFEAIGNWIDGHTTQIVGFVTSIVNGFEKAGEYISIGWDKAKVAVSAVIDYLTPAFQALAPHLASLGNSIMPLVSALGTALLPIVKAVGGALVLAFDGALRVLPPVIDGVTGVIHVITDIVTWLTTTLPSAWDTAFGAVAGIVGPVVGAIEAVWNSGTKLGDYLKQHMDPIIHTTFGIIGDLLRPGITAVADLLSGVTKVGQYIGETLGHVLSDFGTIVGNLVKDVMDPFVKGWNDLWDIMKKVGDYIGGAFTTALDGISHGLSDVKGLLDMVPGLGPDTPGHQYGGPIVRARKGIALNGYGGGDVVPAMLEPGEHVWTKEETKDIGGHNEMFLLRALARHGVLKDMLAENGYAAGGKVRPAGMAHHAEKSWVQDRFKMDEPGKVHFVLGGAVGYDQGGPVGGDPGDGNLAAVLSLLSAESGRTPYVLGGYSPKGIDCSGLVAEAIQVYLGEPVHVGEHPMATGSEAAWLSARGFKQGTGPEGSFRVGFYNGGPAGGHTALTLPDGTNAESGGSGGGVRLGGGAAGANASEFTDHWYLPPREVVAPGGYGGTGSGSSGGYGGAGGSGGGSGGYGGAGGSGSSGPSPAQVESANTAVTTQQGKLDVLNAKISEAQAEVDKAEGAKVGKGPKGEEAHDKRVAAAQDSLKKLTDERDQAQGDLDSITNERDNLVGSRDPKTLIAAQDRITDATRRRDDAQAKLDRDQADPKVKQSTLIADQNALAAANDNVAKATQHLQDVQSKPSKAKGESKDAKSTDFVDVIGKASQDALQENLPPGFSDPTSWAGVKSAAALLKFGAGMAAKTGNGGAAGALTTFGDLLGGSGSGVAKDIATYIAGGTPGMATQQPAATGGDGMNPPVPASVSDLVNQVPGYKPPANPSADPNANGGGGTTVNVDRSAHYTGDITDMDAHQRAKNANDNRVIQTSVKLPRYQFT